METIQETRTPDKTSIEGSQGAQHRLKVQGAWISRPSWRNRWP